MAVRPATKVVVVSIEHVKEQRRSIVREGLEKIVGPGGRKVMRCSICHQPHHTRLYHKSPAIAVLVPNGVKT